jgi:subtilisin family serine protease
MKRRLVSAMLAASAAVAVSGANAQVRMKSSLLRPFAAMSAKTHPMADASGRLPLVVSLKSGQDARSMGLLPLAPGLATLRVPPADLPAFEASHPGVAFSVWPARHGILDESAKLNRMAAYRARIATGAGGGPATSGMGRGVVVGIVDLGLDARHRDLRDENGKTRVAWMLDMSAAAVTWAVDSMRASLHRHVDLETEFGCNVANQTPCAILDSADIDQALSGGSAMYLPTDPIGHGTHVASIAAGDGGDAADARFVGAAPEATLVVANVSNAGGAVHDPDIITGARFVFDRAEALGLPAVVNISIGGDFGPHDGTTPLEKALAAMVGPAHPGRAIVVAGGNSGWLYRDADHADRILGIHTQARVMPGAVARVPLISPGIAGGPALQGSVFVWLTYRKGDNMSVGLSGPDGIFIRQTRIGEEGGYNAPNDKLAAAVWNGVVSEASGLTDDTHGAVIIWSGSWPAGSELAVTLQGSGFADLWLQGEGDGGPDAFSDGQLFEKAIRAGTINIPASHPDLISVGCSVNRTTWSDARGYVQRLDEFGSQDSICYYSSAGPTATGVPKPEISAPGDSVVGAMSKEASPSVQGTASTFHAPSGYCEGDDECFVIDDAHAILSGSSMSAPQVSGAVALLFERDSRLAQGDVSALLQQGARLLQGDVLRDYQMGSGALDVDGMMKAYDARTVPVDSPPDLAASFMSLSDAYVHPDLDWPLVGTVQLRTIDGQIADGFDSSRLSLSTSSSGVVKKPLGRVAPGLWRFEVAGAQQSGRSTLNIDVTFDGQNIGVPGTPTSGHRTLPVGSDRWIAVDEASAFGGGCAIGRRRAVGVAGMGSFLALIAIVGRRSRRGRGKG